jgi:hypothetical protein
VVVAPPPPCGESVRWRGGAEDGFSRQRRGATEAATRGDGAWCTAASVNFVERPSDLNFECVDLIGPQRRWVVGVGGGGGQRHGPAPWFCRRNGRGGRTTGGRRWPYVFFRGRDKWSWIGRAQHNAAPLSVDRQLRDLPAAAPGPCVATRRPRRTGCPTSPWRSHSCLSSPCSFGLSATSQQYFSLRTNQPSATSQQYFSLRTNQHQSSATSQMNRLHIRGLVGHRARLLAFVLVCGGAGDFPLQRNTLCNSSIYKLKLSPHT